MVAAPEYATEALIPQFFAGRSVLVTGATGFVGKVLLERLLTTCPDIFALHLLLRVKKEVTPAERLKELKKSQVFDVLHQKNPSQLDKLHVLCGDVALPGLGLEPGAAIQLKDVSVVFHSAATLKFDEPLRTAVELNVRSVTRMLQLCDQLPNMQSFVYVSTAYSNAELPCVAERVYPPPAPLEGVLSLVDHFPHHILANITQKLIAPKPNTYTFTKALAESVVQQHGNTGYGVSIFRPTIVISAMKNPFPGWIENLNGPSGVIVAAGKGFLHVFPTKAGLLADFLPVDVAVDTLIAVAWETAVDQSQEVRVYNCSTEDNPTSYKHFETVMFREIAVHPVDGVVWYPCGSCVHSKWKHKLLEFLLHTVPLHVADYTARLAGIKTPVDLLKAHKSMTAMTNALEYFSTREFHFERGRVRALRRRLTPADTRLYCLDVNTINWEQHHVDFVKGTRRYLLREKDQDLEKARQRVKKMWVLHNGLKAIMILLFIRVLMLHPAVSAFFGVILIRLLWSIFGMVYRNFGQTSVCTILNSAQDSPYTINIQGGTFPKTKLEGYSDINDVKSS